MEKIRLAKALAAAGVASRRASEQLIFDGRVMVNGETVLLPQTMVDPACDQISVDGRLLSGPEEKVAFVLNKPLGYLCTNRKNFPGEKLVIELFTDRPERLFTVGRLDRDTSGLLIVTNDGQLSQKVIHPSSNVAKTYVVETGSPVSDMHLKRMRGGAEVEGAFVKPVSVRKLAWKRVEIVVMEGKKREVRILVKSAGLSVDALKRTAIGSLLLGDLPLGSYRPLTEEDLTLIFS